MKQLVKIYCLLFFCLLSAFYLQAQSACDDLPLPKERIDLHLDRNICFAGETVWFKAWCFLDEQLEIEMSKVLYVEIFDENQKAIVQEKYLLEHNIATGSIQIPEDVSSKHYTLRAYTRYMRNFSSADFHYQRVTIVNPFIEGESVKVPKSDFDNIKNKDTSKQHAHEPSNKLIEVTLNKNTYNVREKIEFQISGLKSISAELSAVVRMQGLGHQSSPQMIELNPSKDTILPYKNISQLQWRPETRGLTISGLIKSKKNKKIEGALSMVSVLQEKPLLYLGTTDDKGVFTICLHDMNDQKDLHVSTPNNENIILIRNDFENNFPEIKNIPLQFDSSMHATLDALNLNQQLERSYSKNKTQAVFQNKQVNTPSTNILTPDRRVNLADFVKMPSMTEVFEEITPGVLLRKKGGQPSLSVFNSDQQKTYDSPLVLLDNAPVYDIAALLKIDPSKIEAIEIFSTDYFLGNSTLGSIISIISKSDNFGAYKWGDQAAFTKFKTYSIAQPFEQVLYDEKSRIPDFRPVLYWQPNLRLEDQKSNASITLYAPDRPGTYEVLIQGFTDSGEACYAYASFEVVREM